MNTEGQQLPVDSGHAVETLVEDRLKLLNDKRTRSAPFSDYINNRSMSGDQGGTYVNGNSTGKNEVETWLENAQSPSKGSQSASDKLEKEMSAFTNGPDNHIHPGEDRQESAENIPEMDATADDYQQWLMEEEAKIREKAFQGGKRFCVQDIVDNPDLAMAAKEELAPKIIPPVRTPITPQPSNADSMISLAESRVSRLEHMLSISENLDRAADKDMQVSHVELANLIERLKLGRTSCSDLLNLVQRLYRTETMYSASLLECSRPSMSNIGQTMGFRQATEHLCELPMKVRAAHTMVAQSLAGSVSSLDDVLKKFKKLVDELESYPNKMAKDLRMKKIALTRSKLCHEVLCKKLERLNEEETTPIRAASDPWFTEGQVAHNYTQLIQGQANVRKILSDAYDRVTELEVLRLQTSKNVVELLLHTYGASISDTVKPFAVSVSETLEEVDVEDEIDDLRRSVNSSQQSERLLRAQFSEEELMKCAEIFHSPDILRQGALQILDKQDLVWMNGHFVLTRAGLYWFLKESEGSRPDDFISLSRTTIDQVKAPLFKLVERKQNYFGGYCSVVLKAPSVEECGSWIIDLREAIGRFSNPRK